MSNSTKNYAIDPAILTQQAVAGRASVIPDPTAAFWATLFRTANRQTGWEKLDTTATSLDVEVYESRLVVSGTMAFTLPNGSYNKQRKRVVCESAASIPAATLTVTTPDTTTGFATPATYFFDTAGQALEFVWMDDITTPAWRCVSVQRAGGVANNVVVATTVTTGKSLWRTYFLSVTGTVSSTVASAMGIPNGNCVGDTCLVGCSTAASIPSGTIQLAGITNAGSSGATKTLGTVAATANYATLQWDGQFWVVLGNSTLLIS
jgi:hypothetical protein